MRKITLHDISRDCFSEVIFSCFNPHFLDPLLEVFPSILSKASQRFNEEDMPIRKKPEGQWKAELFRAEVLNALKNKNLMSGLKKDEQDCLTISMTPEKAIEDKLSGLRISQVRLLIKTQRTVEYGLNLIKRDSPRKKLFQKNEWVPVLKEKQIQLFENREESQDSFGEEGNDSELIICVFLGCNKPRLDNQTTHCLIIPRGHNISPFYRIPNLLKEREQRFPKDLYTTKETIEEEEGYGSLFATSWEDKNTRADGRKDSSHS